MNFLNCVNDLDLVICYGGKDPGMLINPWLFSRRGESWLSIMNW
jgi:hypothetical protein